MRILLLLFLTAPAVSAQSYDVIISGGRIIDGAGNPWFSGDIGIRGDSIAAMGSLGNASASLRIDAKGFVVSPGFIDIHSHARRGILVVPSAENYIRQGVTTAIEGPDGSSPLPIAPFLDRIAAADITPNFGTFVGQGSVREAVIGSIDRKATPAEIERMQAMVRQGMTDGAFGLSSGLFY